MFLYRTSYFLEDLTDWLIYFRQNNKSLIKMMLQFIIVPLLYRNNKYAFCCLLWVRILDRIKQIFAQNNFIQSLVMNKKMDKHKSKNMGTLEIGKYKSRNMQKQNIACKIAKSVGLQSQKQIVCLSEDDLTDKNELQNILAETQINESLIPKSLNSRNKSCVAFGKQPSKNKACKLMNRLDQQQQTFEQQSQLQKNRRYSYSIQSHSRNNDSLLIQSLQERLQFYFYRTKAKRRKSLNNLHNSQLLLQQKHSSQINFEKLVLWTESKLEKIIKKFFQFITVLHRLNEFNKNARKIGQQRLLMYGVKKYLLQKFKTEKLAKQNFINLCYSLQIHLKKAQGQYSKNHRPKSLILLSKIRSWKVFDRILICQYDYEDISFYLYIKELFNQQKNNQKVFYELNSSILKEFLVALTNNDSELVTYYLKSFKKSQEKGLIGRESIFEIILNDFKIKKEQIRKNFKIYEKNEKECQQKTIASYDLSFWMDEQVSKIPFNPFFRNYQSQLRHQSYKLVNILCCDQPKQQKELILKLIISKTTRILYAMGQLDTQQLYQQFGCKYHLNDKLIFKKEETVLEDIQSLKERYKEIITQIMAQKVQLCNVSRFIKQLLVCKPIKAKLEELIDAFQSQ